MNLYKPMLAKSAQAPFSSPDWIYEIKWDGIRAISYVNNELSIRSRSDKEMRTTFPEFQELKSLARNVVIDGEVVMMRVGKPDFQALMERAQRNTPRNVPVLEKGESATYVVFDILERGGEAVIGLPLVERKRILRSELKEGSNVIISEYVEEKGEEYYAAAARIGLEGIMAKRKDSPYEPGVRSGNWLKIKEEKECDCVILGYTQGEGKRKETIGALLLGLYDNQKLIYVGKVGTGFAESELERLRGLFSGLVTNEQPVEVEIPEEITWIRPDMVCKVGYQMVTKDLRLRMPRYHGIRTDKSPRECMVEQLGMGTLESYEAKRDFSHTSEPLGGETISTGKSFVVQEHHARSLHYDLRLERNGVLKSWAVPKGIPMEAGQRRLAVQVEDHPLGYGNFEGVIPEGQYGAGTVSIWDHGVYDAKLWEKDKIEFSATGEKMHGRYVLIRLKKGDGNNWIVLKARDL